MIGIGLSVFGERLSMLTNVKEDLEESIGDDKNDKNELEANDCQIIEVKKKLGTYKDEEAKR